MDNLKIDIKFTINLNDAFKRIPDLEAGEIAKVKVSDNLYLEVESFEKKRVVDK